MLNRSRFANSVFRCALLTSSACSGTAVYDDPDPTGCDVGHGCPVVTCSCADGSLALDSTCERGNCVDANEVCADRCSKRGGVVNSLATKTDVIAMPTCPTLCDRMYVNDCKIGCELFASECRVAGVVCTTAARDLWECVAGRGELRCEQGALFVEGCKALPLEYCTEAQ